MEKSRLPGIFRYRVSESIAGILRWVVAVTFIAASIPKIMDLGGFYISISNYQMLPESFIPLFATCLISLEFVIGFFLLAGVYKKESAIITIVLNVMFIIALAQALARGIDISCGCFSTNGDAISISDIIRDILLIICIIPTLIYGGEHAELTEQETECQTV